MKKTGFLIFLFFSTYSLLYSQNVSFTRYLPLKVGNVWVYEEHYGYPYYFCYNYHKYRITGTTLINGKTYYQLSVTTVFNLPVCEQGAPNLLSRLYENMLIRLDSITGNIYTSESCGSTAGVLIDSLKSKLGDSATTCIGGNYPMREVCTDTSAVSVLGMNRPAKTFSLPHASGAEYQSYALGIGMYQSGWSESTWWWTETLRGCVISGTLHGDTSLIVGIHTVSEIYPNQISLFQNYPNPFNPVTKIKFSLPLLRLTSGQPSKGGVMLIVFDILGREIANLIPPLRGGQEGLQPGIYEVEWDASNYPSGVYFYKLITADYTQTRKMVLVK